MLKIISFFMLLGLSISLFFSISDQAAYANEPLSPDWSPIVVTSPTSLTPIPDPQDPLCKTYWYTIESAGEYPAYLTLNVTNTSGSTNSGEWRPNIPTTGFYQIEVYIPTHGSLNWGCVIGAERNLDTNQAKYTVSTPSGSKNIIIDQAANAGQWASLGNYFLKQGIDNALSLTDITGETNVSRLVSFSMARFTWLPTQTKVYFPQIFNNYDQATLTKVTLDSVTPYAREGISRLRFDLDEPVTYRITGTNGYASPEKTRLTWNYSGLCGSGSESEILLTVPVGSWSFDLKTSVTGCIGQNTAAIRIYSRSAVLQKTLSINVDAGSTMKLFQGPAFDVCHLPPLDTMQAWWNSSPYSVVNIYMGGISFASGCNYAGLSRDWIKNVQNIGWGFIPTWVGLQAPCSDLKYRFSFDPTTAYNQGKQEANLAVAKALQLGLVGAAMPDTILYYDMEGYSYANNAKDPTVRTQCRTAVSEFLRGWVEQVHSNGMLAGAYGGSYSSYMVDWWSISPKPDEIWAAEWNTATYDPNATVKLKYLGDQYWSNQQRVHQYAGDHYEVWGNRQLAIDSDVSDTTLLMPRFPITKPPVAADLALIGSAKVLDFKQLSLEQGWLLDQNKLYWTEDGGLSWLAKSVPLPEEANLEIGFFLDSSQGWLLFASQAGYGLLSTNDGGTSWQTSSLPDYGPVDALEIAFENSSSGILKFRFQTSQAFREGYTLTTADGGANWQREELAQDDLAWEQLQPIQNGKTGVGENGMPDGAIEVEWFSTTQAWARVYRGGCVGGGEQPGYTCQTAIVLMATSDSGQSWQQIYP